MGIDDGAADREAQPHSAGLGGVEGVESAFEIVYELVTNAARHAFAERPGEIRVELLRAGSYVACKVLDNGSAAAGVQPGHGLKLVDELTKGLDGRFVQKLGSGGSISIIAFPYSWECEEQQRQEPKRNGAGLTAGRAGPQ
jgi:hypothetical protein